MLTSIAIWIGAALATALAMEAWAALLHGRIWHGALWFIHRSHHRRRKGAWELNDALSVLHAPIAIALILYGCLASPGVHRDLAFGVGIGMTLFGVAYVVVHDGLVHQRLPVAWLARVPYLARVREAHLVHHRTGAAPHGLFFGPWVAARLPHPPPPRPRTPTPASTPHPAPTPRVARSPHP
ncbi:sterol desaturase family protein [Chondromyces crocatus]|uniref:Beta-carotene hydroxylase n=1 Tax=Chondromyces crocatus TaxID=52 RepID=A0A0K1E9P8_CHOCO|nr:sterol desaturase family protein [Chondromyces crocatus]AKT37313.1 beta-carotene hydroxylase [Chondromyces crocatus]